jgi:type IV secretion system protein VirD4
MLLSMSRVDPRLFAREPWGPRHQDMEPPFRQGPSPIWRLLGWSVLLLAAWATTHPGGGDPFPWCAKTAIGVLVLMLLVRAVTDGRIPIRWPRASPESQTLSTSGPGTAVSAMSPAEMARRRVELAGGGAYLGLARGLWVTADPEHAVMVLGPPRRGKTSAVMIPALMASSGPAVSTSTKPDVMEATMHARAEIGEVWLFDPSGTEPLPEGVRRLSWSPITAAASWDGALLMARAMTAASRVGAGTTNENHWTERAAALLAPLLYAAQLTGRPVEEVLRWTLRQDLAPALEVLADADSEIAADVLVGIERTDARERSSIFSATAGVLSAYNSDGARESAAHPNFDPARFAASTDTIYVTSPEQHQAACAPLIVGLLEQIRHAKYAQVRTADSLEPWMHWFLDELPNIAPIHDLPALVSQAGGQGLQVVAGLQDFSQARTRWGTDAADGFLSLFQIKLILNGVSEPRTLDAISTVLGEYDRDMTTLTLGRSEPQEWRAEPTHSDTVSYQTQRQRVLTPGEVAKLPAGRGLLLRGTDWTLLGLTPYHKTEPWKTIAAKGPDPTPAAP